MTLGDGGTPSTRMGSPTRSTLKGSTKKKKLERKAKEQADRRFQELNDQIGRLEDRDTQQNAFLVLIETLPQLELSRVSEVYALIERSKSPQRSSTRRMLVLLLAVLCRYRPTAMARLLSRVLAYVSLRLRDNESRVSEACAILVSAVSMSVIPVQCTAAESGSAADAEPQNVGGSDHASKAFETVAAALQKDVNAVGEGAVRCLCSLILPTEFDGTSRPPAPAIVAHSRRILPFIQKLLPDMMAKIDGSMNFSGFSPVFLQLHAVCSLANEADQKGEFSGLKECFAPFVESVFEGIEDMFKYGPRDDWMLRKRGIELLTLLMETFALDSRSGVCSSIRTYFQNNLERCRALVMSGRHDSGSSVREAAAGAARVFDKFEKQLPARPCEPPRKPVQDEFARSNDSRSSSENIKNTVETAFKQETISADSDAEASLAELKDESVEFGDIAGDEAALPEDNHEESEHDVTSSESNDLADETKTQSSSLTNETKTHDEKADVVSMVKIKPRRRRFDQLIPRVSSPKRAPLRQSPAWLNSAKDNSKQNDDDQNEQQISLTRAEAALVAAECGESEIALRLCLLEDDLDLLRQTLSTIGTPCMAALSRASRNALCMAFLAFLDSEQPSNNDCWLVFHWLESMVNTRRGTEQNELELDPRIRDALTDKLAELSYEPTRLALEAARILERLEL